MLASMSFQAIMEDVRRILYAVSPAVGLFILITATWYISRFTARFFEQQRIMKYMPDIVKEEVQRRDKLIVELRGQVRRLESEALQRTTALKSAYVMAGRVQEIVMAVGANGAKRIEALR